MNLLHGGAAVIAAGEFTEAEGRRHYRMPISRLMGARDIAQTISVYDAGLAPARRNPSAAEVLYVVGGEGVCHLDGFGYELAKGVAVYVPPGRVCQIESAGGLEIVSVACPEDDEVEVGVETITRGAYDTKPALAVPEQFQKEIATGDRTFKLLVSHELGARRVRD